ncbi:hypothetical protein N9C39_11200, partial [Luminiphilus sp.]|nr:hypothetical protein [Luminiphilus sp.]
WVLTFFPCIIVIGGVYSMSLLLVERVSAATYRKYRDEGWGCALEALPWIGALVANFYVHRYFDLFSIFW